MKFVLLSFVLAIQIPALIAWGALGHMVVGQLGWNMLSTENQNLIYKFLGNNATLAEIAPLPDDYRYTPQGNWSEPCHFCNLPRNATNFTMAYCPQFCVVKSITNYTQILTSEVRNPFQCNFDTNFEPCALEFLTHFVGDVHQPLHVSYAYDLGGNDVKVEFFGTQTNLHHVWDTNMIDWWIYKGNWTDLVANLTDVIQNNPNIVKEYLKTMNPIDWADESFQYVLNDVYVYSEGDESDIHARDREQFLSNRKDKKKSNPVGSIHITDAEPDLKWWYYNHNMPIVMERLTAAGVRLGHLLNTICDSAK